MKKKYSFSLVLLLGLVLGLASFFTSCTKERLQRPTENNVATSSLMQEQVATVRQGSLTANATTLTANKPTIPSPDIGYNLVANGLYSISPMAHSDRTLLLNVLNLQDGAIIQQTSPQFAHYVKWRLTYLGNGYYSIINFFSGKSLDVPNSSLATGTKIQQHTYHGGANQQWKIGTSVSTGISRIYNRQSGLALDVPDASGISGVSIQQFTPHNGLNQAWRITPFPPDIF